MAPLDLTRDIILRWDGAGAADVPLFEEGGITAIVADEPAAGFVEACGRAGLTVVRTRELRFVSLDEWSRPAGSEPAILSRGVWPGATRPSGELGDVVAAGASGQPWLDANLHWYAWLREMNPRRPAVLGYLPDERAGVTPDRMVAFHSLEAGLAEARVSGGNWLLAMEPRYREALRKGDEKARAAWRHLGSTARWLRENAALFATPPDPTITALQEHGEETAEIANLLFRHNGSPALAPLASPPPPDPDRRLALVAANLHAGAPAAAERILAHARAGATVILDDGAQPAWWKQAVSGPVREEHDRSFYRCGRGQLVAYQERIADPSEFALDVIDIVTHVRRPVRLWGTGTVIASLRRDPSSRRATLILMNYGSPNDNEILIHVRGAYRSARLLRPGASDLELTTAQRKTATEVRPPGLDTVAAIVFQ